MTTAQTPKPVDHHMDSDRDIPSDISIHLGNSDTDSRDLSDIGDILQMQQAFEPNQT